MAVARHKRVWGRVFCVLVSAVSLSFVFSRLDTGQLWQALRSAHPGWYALAILSYGALFLPASRRWHLVLESTGLAVNASATLRTTMVGHFFYLIFFGAIGGDAARSGWYARRFGLPLPGVLATAPLDRLFGLAGLLLLGGVTAGLALSSGALAALGPVRFRWPGIWLGMVGLVIAGVGVWIWRAAPDSFPRRVLQSLRQSGRSVLLAPRICLRGITYGVLVQVALNATTAFNLQAVSTVPVPWFQLAWTFPLISLMGALPITVAGLGARETAALALLAIYGIPPEQAVTASLMTMSANLCWAAVGGLVLWRESLPSAQLGATGPKVPHSA